MSESWDYCDRSPCTRLIEALGRWIYGNPTDGTYVVVICRANSMTKPMLSEVRYCPFCGCRLDQLILKAGQAVELPDS